MTGFNIKKLMLAALVGAAGIGSMSAESVILTVPADFQVIAISPNGKWACGVYINSAMVTNAFRWNLESGDVEMISDSNESIAWGIANDGTISGNYSTAEVLPQGRSTQMPAVNRVGRGWELLELPENCTLGESYGYSITPDGRCVSGTLFENGLYVPYIWHDGKIYRKFETGKHAMGYAISPDGESVAGWAYGQKQNRVATYWKPDGTPVYFLDARSHAESMFATAHCFSPDGKKVLYWGGWDYNDEETENALYCLYDIATDTRTKIPTDTYSSTLQFFDMTDTGFLVGEEKERGYVYYNGKGMYIDDYLKEIGVDLSTFDDFYAEESAEYGKNLPISRVMNVSDDGKTLIMLFYDKTGRMRTMCLKTDVDVSILPPAGLAATPLVGVNTVELKWKAPIGMPASSVRGYNIYRDGKKLNLLPQVKLSYYDSKLAEGTYEYKVGTVNIAGKEMMAEPVTVTVAAPAPAAPSGLLTRAKGVNSAFMSWSAPESPLSHKRYYNPMSKTISPMSVYAAVTMEGAVRFGKDEIKCYKGSTINEVSFMPMAEHDSWKIVFYTRDADGALKELKSVPVTQELNYKKINVVTLDEPVDVPEGDLYVAVQVAVREGTSDVIAVDEGPCVPGYSDLLRQITEEDYISAYESSVAGGYSVSSFNWLIDVAFQTPGENPGRVLSHYNVYADGVKTADTKEPLFLVENLADGSHELAVEAEYTNGELSDKIGKPVDIKAVYAGVEAPEVKVDVADGKGTVNASWTAPVNIDRYHLTYAASDTPTRGVKSVGNALIIGADYCTDLLKGYAGYKIDKISFYPLCEGIFTVGIYCNGKNIFEKEVDTVALNEWNTVSVDKDLRIDEVATYRVVVDVFDAEPEKEVFGVDNFPCFESRSDLYSIDNGETWNSLSVETGLNRSWLLSMDLVEDAQSEIDPEGYDVVVDGDVVNPSRLTATEYAFEKAPDKVSHRLAVRTYYPAVAEAVEGGATMFRIQESGIDESVITSITLRQGSNLLVADGEGVQSIALISADGIEVAKAAGDRIDISSMADGIYVAVVRTTSGGFSQKVRIRH